MHVLPFDSVKCVFGQSAPFLYRIYDFDRDFWVYLIEYFLDFIGVMSDDI